MLAATLTLALFSLVLALIVNLFRTEGRKVIAALEGRSWTAQPTAGRPVTIRFSSSLKAAAPNPCQPALRAAA